MLKLAEDLEKLDKLRRQTRNAIIFVCVFIAFTMFCVFKVCYGSSPVSTPLYYSTVYIGAIISAALPLTVSKIRRRYKKLYNAVIVRNSLERYFEIEECGMP